MAGVSLAQPKTRATLLNAPGATGAGSAPVSSARVAKNRADCLRMIHPYDNQTQTRWDRGEFKVQLNAAHASRPIGFCDGTEADIAELQERAEAEGADSMAIQRKLLKTGREVWTLG